MKRILITLILLIILSACSQKVKGQSIFEGRLCGKSCWDNIIIGVTTRDEFLDIISTIPNVDQDSIKIYGDPDEYLIDETISFQFYRIPDNKKSVVYITAKTIDKKIVLMTFWGDLRLIFQDVVNAFGEPDFATSLRTFDGGVNVHFINSSQGVEIFSYFKNENSSVSPDMEVNYLELFDPNMYQVFMEANFFIADYESYILYPWAGYGMIEDHYWPPQ